MSYSAPYDGRQDPPSPTEVTNRPSSHSRPCDDFIFRLRCIIQCLSGSRWQDKRGGAVFPRNERTDLSPSPESETLHLRLAWWAFKSLKWVFGSVSPQEVAHLSIISAQVKFWCVDHLGVLFSLFSLAKLRVSEEAQWKSNSLAF